jgi:hypothetical protein
MAMTPPGYRFLRLVLIVGATAFGLLGVFYMLNGQFVPGLFALFVTVIEIAALPMFRRLYEMSRSNPAEDAGNES